MVPRLREYYPDLCDVVPADVPWPVELPQHLEEAVVVPARTLHLLVDYLPHVLQERVEDSRSQNLSQKYSDNRLFQKNRNSDSLTVFGLFSGIDGQKNRKWYRKGIIFDSQSLLSENVKRNS